VPELTHVDAQGRPRMVDVGEKAVTRRSATAEGFLSLSPAAHAAVAERRAKKGDVAFTAELAGIQGAKRTADLIPLCHPLVLDAVEVEVTLGADHLRVTATVRTEGRTGVEMEALCAVTTALLTAYDMLKAVDRTLSLGPVRLLAKSGGRSGDWVAPERPER
jgi:cyclic pyranopterin phosphate synthase